MFPLKETIYNTTREYFETTPKPRECVDYSNCNKGYYCKPNSSGKKNCAPAERNGFRYSCEDDRECQHYNMSPTNLYCKQDPAVSYTLKKCVTQNMWNPL